MRRLLVILIATGLAAASCSSEGDDTASTKSTVAAAPATDPPAETDPPEPEPATSSEPPVETSPPVSEAPPATEPPAGEPVAVPGLPAAYVDYTSEIYADDAVWLCRGGTIVDDICERDLDATAVFADGTTEPRPHERASNPVADCFYVYPTVSQDEAASSDLVPSESDEINTTLAQAARLTGACRVFAPVYRQVTIGALFDTYESDESNRTLAYDDVVDAFRHFVANDSDGRPFVLIGHSQGAGILRRMIADEIDGEPALRDRLVSAILLGTSVAVDEYDTIPTCATSTDVHCVVSYSSYRDTAPPPPGAFFGSVDGTPAVCVNPVDPAGAAAPSSPYFSLLLGDGTLSSAVAYDPDATPAEIATAYVTYPDMVTIDCVDDGTFGYLELSITTEPGPRRDDIGGDLTPEWGMHLVDANVAMGDLVTLVEQQSAALGG